MAHPISQDLTRWLKAMSAAGDRRLLRHVLQCSTCREQALADLDRLEDPTALADLLHYPSRNGAPAPPDPVPDDRYAAMFRRFSSQVVSRAQREHQEAVRLFDELMSLSPAQQELKIRNGGRYRSPALAQALLQRSREVGFDEPGEGERLALLGLAAVEAADTQAYGQRLLDDLRARAWSHVGNARRQREDLQGADAAFQHAAEALEGTADPVEEAGFLHMLAALRRMQRRFGEAQRLLQRAAALYREAGDREKLAQVLTSLGVEYLDAAESEAAMEPLLEARQLVEPEKDPRTALYVLHSLTWALLQTDRVLEAQRTYLAARSLYERFPDQFTQVRRDWLEGNLALHTGQAEEAERLLLSARRAYQEAGQSDHAASVDLDLATLYAQEERTEDLRRLMADLTRVFRSTPVRRDARAALALLNTMAQQEQSAREVLVAAARKAVALLKRSRHELGG